MEDFRLKTLENEENLVLSHKQELIDLNKMLEKLKSDQEKQYKQFEAVNKKYESDKLYLVEDLKSKHRLEIESLKQSFNSNKDVLDQEKRKLEEKYESELNKLKSDLENVNSRNLKEKAEYEQNILKLKTFHEKELEALRQNSSSEYEKLIKSLKNDLDSLGKQKIAKEAEFNQRYNNKVEEILQKEDMIQSLNEQIKKLESNVHDSNKNFMELNEKVK